MQKIKYIVKRIFNMNFGNFFKTINNVSKKSKKLKIVIFFDIIICGLKYQAGYNDYELFAMYNLNHKQRKTVLTRGKNNAFVKRYNDPDYLHFFQNKEEFNEKFKKFVKRDYIYLTGTNKEEFDDFIRNKKYIFGKATNGTHGDGMEKINVSEWKNKDLYQYCFDKKMFLLEELVIQDERINKLYPGAINTIRTVTFFDGKEAHVICAYLRCGLSKHVDNFNSGGVVVPIDLNDGTIKYPAIAKNGKIYYNHPQTKTSFINFKIPEFKSVLEIAKEAAAVIPNVGYVGWDVAISNKGPLIIEGNEYPGHDIYQLPIHTPDGYGVLPSFEKVMKK